MVYLSAGVSIRKLRYVCKERGDGSATRQSARRCAARFGCNVPFTLFVAARFSDSVRGDVAAVSSARIADSPHGRPDLFKFRRCAAAASFRRPGGAGVHRYVKCRRECSGRGRRARPRARPLLPRRPSRFCPSVSLATRRAGSGGRAPPAALRRADLVDRPSVVGRNASMPLARAPTEHLECEWTQ